MSCAFSKGYQFFSFKYRPFLIVTDNLIDVGTFENIEQDLDLRTMIASVIQ